VSDRDMAAALAAGDRQAVAQVYDVYGARLYSYAYELVADRARAADAVRDAITVAAYRADELVDTESLGAWLFALVRV
jgi:DNA-directed RNA polymerase specialized sigma24 family protein